MSVPQFSSQTWHFETDVRGELWLMRMTVTASLIKRTTPPTVCHVKLLLPTPRRSQGQTRCQKNDKAWCERLTTFVSWGRNVWGVFKKHCNTPPKKVAIQNDTQNIHFFKSSMQCLWQHWLFTVKANIFYYNVLNFTLSADTVLKYKLKIFCDKVTHLNGWFSSVGLRIIDPSRHLLLILIWPGSWQTSLSSFLDVYPDQLRYVLLPVNSHFSVSYSQFII